MISYGSQQDCTPMSPCDRSHQLGEGQSVNAAMSPVFRPSQPVYGSQILIAETLWGKRSHQLGEGQAIGAGMPSEIRPPQLVLESQGSNAEMPMRDRSQGEGQRRPTAMSRGLHPPQLVSRRQINRYRNVTPTPPPEGRVNYPSQECHKENTLPHQFWATFTTQQCQLIFAHQFWATPKAPQGQRPLAQF